MPRRSEDLEGAGPETFAFIIGDILLKIDDVCFALVRSHAGLMETYMSLSMLSALVMEYAKDDVENDKKFLEESEEMGWEKVDTDNIDPEDWQSILAHLKIVGAIARSLRRQGIIGHQHMERLDITPDVEAAAVERGWGPNPKGNGQGSVS